MRTGCLSLIALIPTASAAPGSLVGNIVGGFFSEVKQLANGTVPGPLNFKALVQHGHHQNTPSGFVQAAPAPPDTNLNLRLDLTPGNHSALEQAFLAASTPGSSSYRNFLTKERVQTLLQPSPDSISLVNQWLQNSSITPTSGSPDSGSIQFTIPVSHANTLFATNYSFFTHSQSGQQIVRTLSYSIPQVLQGHIKFIHPTTSFVVNNSLAPIIHTPAAKPPKAKGSKRRRYRLDSRQVVGTSCANGVNPLCLQTLYGIPSTSPGNTTLGVSGFGGQFANNIDLQTFLGNFNISTPTFGASAPPPFQTQFIDGGENLQDAGSAGTEANLDIQYTVGLAADVPVTFISVGDANEDGVSGFLDLVDNLINSTDRPTVLTTSYGFNEEDLTPDIAHSLCNAYMSLGALGVSVLFASGDGGVGGSQPGAECATGFLPTFPATCPFVTVVGATTFAEGSTTAETAAQFSSGGFSNIFAQPAYQTTAVSSYLTLQSATLSTIGNLFNTTGRAYPDVSAQGQNVQIVVNESSEGVDGTSCSSPIFASVISLVNSALADLGQPPLGFLNYWLYNITTGLVDVTSGSNPGCGTQGFPAAVGWDPVTGLGTPSFKALLAAVPSASAAPILPETLPPA